MTEMGAWLKEIIVIALLAVFTDLLLPSQSMQRYVRMVMGLAIIAVMIQPIVPFFQRDWVTKVATLATEEVTSGTQPTVPLPAAASQYRQDLATQEDIQANQLAAADLSHQITAHFECDVKSVTISGTAQAPASVAVQVVVGWSSYTKVDAIARWVAVQMGIPVVRVRVTTG